MAAHPCGAHTQARASVDRFAVSVELTRAVRGPRPAGALAVLVRPKRQPCRFVATRLRLAPSAQIKLGDPKGRPFHLVEVARIELASASPPLQGLHAYTVFSLVAGYPTGRDNLQPVR